MFESEIRRTEFFFWVGLMTSPSVVVCTALHDRLFSVLPDLPSPDYALFHTRQGFYPVLP